MRCSGLSSLPGRGGVRTAPPIIVRCTVQATSLAAMIDRLDLLAEEELLRGLLAWAIAVFNRELARPVFR